MLTHSRSGTSVRPGAGDVLYRSENYRYAAVPPPPEQSRPRRLSLLGFPKRLSPGQVFRKEGPARRSQAAAEDARGIPDGRPTRAIVPAQESRFGTAPKRSLVVDLALGLCEYFGLGAGWSSPVARWAHNPKVAGSNPAPATRINALSVKALRPISRQGFSASGGSQIPGG